MANSLSHIKRGASIISYLYPGIGNRNFWITRHYVSTVRLHIATIQKYIKEQPISNRNKFTTKEYKNPFKVSR